MELYEILDEMEELIKDATRIPLSGKVMIDPEELLEIMDRLRAIVPEELQEARSLLEDQQTLFDQAQRAAQDIIDESQQKAARYVENNKITKQAHTIAQEMITRAESLAQEIKMEANQYAEDMLKHMERVLQEGLGSIQKGRHQLKQVMGEKE